MAYTICDSCVFCGSCEGECPVTCIAERGYILRIDENCCID